MKLKRCCLVALMVILTSCSSAPEEEYFDYFYTTKTTKETKSFTYILYLGEEGNHNIPSESRQPRGFPESERERQSTSRQRSSRAKNPKADDFMSLSFRMEEEAFKRLEKRLADENYCNETPDFSVSEYTWLAYTIKGSCS